MNVGVVDVGPWGSALSGGVKMLLLSEWSDVEWLGVFFSYPNKGQSVRLVDIGEPDLRPVQPWTDILIPK